jgi:branched-subunit amino acid transport protein
MSAWIALIVASLLTLGLRAGPSLLGGGVAVPAALRRANRFAAPALMGALASRSVAAQAAATGGLAVVLPVAIAAAIAVRTRSMLATIVGGTAAHLVVVELTVAL